MKQRILTAIIFGSIVLGLLFGHPYSRILFLALVPILASIEYLKLTGARLTEVLFIAVAVFLIIFLIESYYIEANDLLLPALMINLLLFANMFLDKPFIKHEKSKSIICLFYLICPFIMAYYNEWAVFPVYLIATVLLIWISDSAAFFVGSRIGHRKLFLKISPGKTWEGLWGAGLITVIAGYIVFSITGKHDLQFWVLFSIIIWLVGATGDLIASHVKRIAGVKDSGSILPGHGGFYDRFDAIIYLLPFLILFNQLYNL